jgi:DNA-binding SARP family transcriptional activator
VSDLQFGILGPLEVRRSGEPLAIHAPKQRALLALVLLHANRPVPRDELIDQLWGEDTPPSARASLQNQVYALRKILGPTVLERRQPGYVIHVEPGQLDLERFERLVTEARGAQPRERAAKLRRALALWRGPVLMEFRSGPFAQHEINRLEEERLTALEDRIEAELELGREIDLVPELEALIGQYPLRERLWAQLMLALYRAGRQADALAAYRHAHHTFVSELAVEPGVGMRELQRAILVQDPALDDGGHRIGSTLERAAAILPMPAPDQADSLYQYGVALLRIGDLRRAASVLEAAQRLAVSAGASGVEERAYLYLSYLRIWTEGKSPLEHLAEAERAARHFEQRGDEVGLWVALRQQAQMLQETGRADAALVVSERCSRLAPQNGSPWLQTPSRNGLIDSLVLGSTPVDEAIARCEDELAASLNEVNSIRVSCGLAVLYGQAGRVEDARGLVERALAAAQHEGGLHLLVDALTTAGAVEFSAGNLGEAANHMRSAYGLLEVEDDRATFPMVAAELACVLALSGDGDAGALALTARAATSPDFFKTEVLWRRALAIVAACAGRSREARQLSDEASARASVSDWLTFRAETLEEAATIRELGGDVDAAVRALREALATYEKKGNVVGVGRARRRLEELG